MRGSAYFARGSFAEQVLRHSAGTRTLATSREALGVPGEVAWRLPSLRTAPPDAGSIDDFLAFPAIRLFVERAQAVAPAFRLTTANLGAAARACHQLDGIPLALELAAARVGALTVDQFAERLDDRFALLTRGRRTVLQRHQTLRSLIDWSHDLLDGGRMRGPDRQDRQRQALHRARPRTARHHRDSARPIRPMRVSGIRV